MSAAAVARTATPCTPRPRFAISRRGRKILELMTFAPPGGTGRVNRCWEMPRSYDELVRRRRALVAWSETKYGFMGRSPDHVASTLLGQVVGIEVFRRHGDGELWAGVIGCTPHRASFDMRAMRASSG
jgi:hypothetical protein